MIKTWFAAFVLLSKFVTLVCSFIGSIFICIEAEKRYNKLWVSLMAFLLSMFIFGVAIFWNYADHPLRAWNPMYTDSENDE